MGRAKRHLKRLQKQIDLRLGKGKAVEILQGLDDLTDSETAQECFEWASRAMERLEDKILIEDLIPIREGCACMGVNKDSPVAKIFPELRAKHPDDDDAYLNAVAEHLTTKTGRCGDLIEYKDGKLVTNLYKPGHTQCTCAIFYRELQSPSKTWCYCCQGLLKNVYECVFPEKECHMNTIETLAIGGANCIFETWFT